MLRSKIVAFAAALLVSSLSIANTVSLAPTPFAVTGSGAIA